MKVLDVFLQLPNSVFFFFSFLGVCVALDLAIQVGKKLFKCSAAIGNIKCFLSPSPKIAQDFRQKFSKFSLAAFAP